MRQPSPRWPAWHNRLTRAGFPDGGARRRPLYHGSYPRMARPHPSPPPPGVPPLRAPAALRAEEPDQAGVRQGLVAYYRQLLSQGDLDTPERFAAAETRLIAGSHDEAAGG